MLPGRVKITLLALTKMDEILYTLGGVTFTAKMRPLLKKSIKNSASWVAMSRIGSEDPLQFTGFKNHSISLTGVTFSALGAAYGLQAAGLNQINEIVALQKQGVPFPLVDGSGVSYGLFAILDISDEQEDFLRNGDHQTSSYSIDLLHYTTDVIGGDGIVSSGAFDISQWQSQIKSFVGGLTEFFK